jgi:hypothetical protein
VATARAAHEPAEASTAGEGAVAAEGDPVAARDAARHRYSAGGGLPATTGLGTPRGRLGGLVVVGGGGIEVRHHERARTAPGTGP